MPNSVEFGVPNSVEFGVPTSVEFGTVVLETKILNVFSLFRNYLLLGKGCGPSFKQI